MSIEKNKFYYSEWHSNRGTNHGIVYVSDIENNYVRGAVQYNCASFPELFNTLRVLDSETRFGAGSIRHEVTLDAVKLHQPLLYEWYLENILQESSNILTNCL
jgi:hypothetical protein